MIELLRVPLKNRPGQLHDVITTISKAGVDMKALSLTNFDAEESEVLLLVTHLAKARHALDLSGRPSAVQQAVAVEVADETGGLASVLEATTKSQLSVEALFTFVTRVEGKALAVATFKNNLRAETKLREAGIITVDQRTIDKDGETAIEAEPESYLLDDYLGGSFFW